MWPTPTPTPVIPPGMETEVGGIVIFCALCFVAILWIIFGDEPNE